MRNCKPGSVFKSRSGERTHFRERHHGPRHDQDPEVTIPLGRSLPNASSGLTREERDRSVPSPEGLPPLFDLAPSRVCRATSVTGSAVSSYLAVSPLPTLRRTRAVCFLLHFPSPCAAYAALNAWPLASTVLRGARTFLSLGRSLGSDHPFHIPRGVVRGFTRRSKRQNSPFKSLKCPWIFRLSPRPDSFPSLLRAFQPSLDPENPRRTQAVYPAP